MLAAADRVYNFTDTAFGLENPIVFVDMESWVSMVAIAETLLFEVLRVVGLSQAF